MTIKNYYHCKPLGWRRVEPLDWFCENQREQQLRKANTNYKGRKKYLIETYHHLLRRGLDRGEAYEQACWSQFFDRPSHGMTVNIDSRTQWEFTD